MATYLGKQETNSDCNSGSLCRRRVDENSPHLFQLVPIYDMVHTMIASMTSRVFTGLPRCRDETWMRTVKAYPRAVQAVAADSQPLPAFLRPMIAPFLTSTRRLKHHQSTAQTALNLADFKEDEAVGNGTLLRWMVDAAKGVDSEPLNIVQRLLMLTMAAFHTSTLAVVHALYDLCAMPDNIEPLRREAESVVHECSSWQLPSLDRLEKLDSFLKESQRMNHPGL